MLGVLSISMFSFLKKDTGMFLIVGLGNYGKKYAKNRHNVGFMLVDVLHDFYHFKPFRKKFQGEISEGRIEDHKILLLKPQTYMNNSGQSVKAAAKFYKIPPSRIIVVHDELDLKLGDNRLKSGGGLAGHNGLKSIKAYLGTADFLRLRIGIDHPGDKNRVSDYVLSDFAKTDLPKIESGIYEAAKHIALLLNGDIEQFDQKIKV
jgi:PTH1 family peptidyl-tRNA hydrolase